MTRASPIGATQTLSTATVERGQAFEYWQDLICDTFVQLSASPTTNGPFRGRITNATYPDFEMSTVRAAGQRVRRTRRLIARADEEFILASIQIRGRGRVEQAGRVAFLEPGSMAFYDSTAPYVLHFDDAFEQIVVQLPRQALLSGGGAATRAAQATAVRLDGRGAAGVVAAFFTSLAHAEQHDPTGAAVMSSHAGALMASALNLACGLPPTGGADSAVQREQVLGFLRLHAADPGLDVDAVARGCHLSRRTLFRLFHDADVSLAGALRRIRVERARHLLREQVSRPVNVIGSACGFASESQFHRVFRDLTGCTPAAYRGSNGSAT